MCRIEVWSQGELKYILMLSCYQGVTIERLYFYTILRGNFKLYWSEKIDFFYILSQLNV